MPTALIVEDEPAANTLLAMLVQLRGYRTVSAFTGGEALDTVDRDPPDIVFLDLMLPDLNGYEVCKALKSRKATTLIPVVMVTARVAVENRIQSYCVGADYYVPKPYTPDQIFQAMADADDWRRRVDRQGTEGAITFTTRDEGESLRQLAQFRSLVLARTPIELDAACRLNDGLRGLWNQADAWGQSHDAAEVATLTFHAFPDRLVLTLRDHAGWFRDDPRPPSERWSLEMARAGFDEVRVDCGAGSVTFVVRFRGKAAPGPA